MNDKILSLNAAVRRCRALQQRGQRVVLTNGCFDLLHIGHLRCLRKARELGEVLVVAINSDDSVRALKGPGRPIVPEAERVEVIASLDCVDYVTVFQESTAARLVAELRPDIYVKGGDYGPGRCSMPEAQVVAEYGATAVFLEYVPGTSTTGIIETILSRGRDGLLSWQHEAHAAEGGLR